MYKESKLAKNKAFGTLLMILGVFGFLIIIHRLCYYKFEYDEKFSPSSSFADATSGFSVVPA